MNRKQLQEHYRDLLTDLGPWAEAFNLPPDAPVVGTGRPAHDEPVIRCGDTCVYRRHVDELGDVIYVHKQLPDGSGGEGVFMLRPREGRAPELLGDCLLLPPDTPAPPCPN